MVAMIVRLVISIAEIVMVTKIAIGIAIIIAIVLVIFRLMPSATLRVRVKETK